LANVVQEASALRDSNIKAQFTGHQSHQVGDLDGMIEEILRVTMAEMQAAQNFYNFLREGRQASPGNGAFAKTNDGFVHLLIHFGDDFLDARRVNAAISDQPLHRFAGYLAADGIEP